MPADAPEICRRECVAAGADLHVVDGLITDAPGIAVDARQELQVAAAAGW